MGSLIEAILGEAGLDVDSKTLMQASDIKLREMLVWQLATGYKLREMEARNEIKDKFWGQ